MTLKLKSYLYVGPVNILLFFYIEGFLVCCFQFMRNILGKFISKNSNDSTRALVSC